MMRISPISGNKLEFYIKTKDYLNTQEEFELYYDKEWDMLITFPVPEDLSKYYQTEEYKPHRTTIQSIFDIAYNIVRDLGFKKKLKLIRSVMPDVKKILDYGCATGEFVKFLKDKGFIAKGLEPEDNSRRQAEKLVNDKVYKDINEIDDKFDVITMWHVLEHIPNLSEVMEKFKNILNRGGYLFIAVPNFKSYDANYYKEYWAAYDVPRHLWHFSPRAMKKLSEKFNYEFVSKYPLVFDSYYVSLLSEKYKTGSKNIIKAIRVGMRSNSEGKRTGNYSSLIYVLKNI